MSSQKTSILVIAILGFLFNCKKDIAKMKYSYYDNGNLQVEIPLVDGMREGLGIEYFPNGKIKSTVNWKNNKKNGETIIYYENGNMRQVNQYHDDIRCCISKDFFEDGPLKQITKLDSNGRIIDYYFLNKDGTRDFDSSKKDAIFIHEKDTIFLGERYIARIRLSNRQFKKISVHIGDLLDEDIIIKTKPLPKTDSFTSILNIPAKSVGSQTVTGYILESNLAMDSINLIPFKRSFYVKDTIETVYL